MADPISILVMMGVAVSVIVADECYKAYKKRKARKAVEREFGLGPAEREEVRRIRRERERERREREREIRRCQGVVRERERERERQRRRGDVWDGFVLEGGEGGVWDEISEGGGLPEYSVRPRDGVVRAVSVQGLEGVMVNGQRRKGLKGLFKRRQSEPGPVVEGGVQRMQRRRKGWFKRKKGQRGEEQSRAMEVSGPPPPYEEIGSGGT